MRTDIYGQIILDDNDICDLYLKDPDIKLKNVLSETDIQISDILGLESIPKLKQYIYPNVSIEEFDLSNTSNWHMPDEYKKLDIALYILEKCSNEEELQRAGEELFLFQERNMFPLLQYLKYLVDTMRQHNIVWGVGRGSSVASFVLFLIGVHKINSLYYDLSIEEFIK